MKALLNPTSRVEYLISSILLRLLKGFKVTWFNYAQDDDDGMPEYGDESVGEITDEMIDQANDKRSAAMDAAAEGWLEMSELII